MSDIYDDEAEKLLPCDCDGILYDDGTPVESHTIVCAAYYRPAVATRLREQGEQNRVLADNSNSFVDTIAQSQAEIERLKNALACDACDGSGQAGSWPCGCRGKGLPEMLLTVRLELHRAHDAINETLRLADFLNQAAEQGAGYYFHWGERVMQAVEPLRDVKAFASKILEHNRVLLEANDQAQAEITALRAQLEEARELGIISAANFSHWQMVYRARDWLAALVNREGK